MEEAKQFAEVSPEGVVTLLDGDEKVEVGQVHDASSEEAVAYYVRKYDDVMTQLQLLKQRLETDVSNQELEKTLNQIDETITARQMVGDMAQLREFSKQLRNDLVERRDRKSVV